MVRLLINDCEVELSTRTNRTGLKAESLERKSANRISTCSANSGKSPAHSLNGLTNNTKFDIQGEEKYTGCPAVVVSNNVLQLDANKSLCELPASWDQMSRLTMNQVLKLQSNDPVTA